MDLVGWLKWLWTGARAYSKRGWEVSKRICSDLFVSGNQAVVQMKCSVSLKIGKPQNVLKKFNLVFKSGGNLGFSPSFFLVPPSCSTRRDRPRYHRDAISASLQPHASCPTSVLQSPAIDNPGLYRKAYWDPVFWVIEGRGGMETLYYAKNSEHGGVIDGRRLFSTERVKTKE